VGAVDEGEFRAQLNVAFAEWADRWLASLERKDSTIQSDRPTMGYAKETLGTPCDDCGRKTSRRSADGCEVVGSRHRRARSIFRVLSLGEAAPEREEATFFTNDELTQLVAEIPDGMTKVAFTLL